MIVAGSLIVFLYILTLGMFFFANRSIRSVKASDLENKIRFSIVVPFRNEAGNLDALLDSLRRLKYPSHMFEVVFVNDDSSDESEIIIHSALEGSDVQYKIVNNERYSASPKKDALSKAVNQARYEWIMSTDADCYLHKELLNCYDNYIQSDDPYMIVGAIGLLTGSGLNFHFQQFEQLALQAMTAGGFGLKNPFLCNGANLVYLKDRFMKVDGYAGNDHISSGDDIFLLEKFRREYPGKIHYVRSDRAIVLTSPLKSWRDLIEQRVRWASKISWQKNFLSKWVGLLVLLTNLWLIAGLFQSIFIPEQFKSYILLLIYKSLVDLIIITSSSLNLRQRVNLFAFLIISLIYPFVQAWVFIRSLLGTYRWKDRHYERPHI
jgi:glycosyltransferase involved in cell wall biosynthesis